MASVAALRAKLSTDVVIDEAARLIDERGPEGLTLAALADNLGVRIPSLYKHVDGMPAIQRGIRLVGKSGLANALAQAAIGKSRDDAITAMAIAYRAWALEHPGQYPMTMGAPRPDDEQDLAASVSLVAVIYEVLAGYDIRGDDAVDATRFLRASLHGFVALETSGAFEIPVNLERSFQRLVESVVTALATWSRSR
jgi:AcrR family transcriptional regulator